ncbi:GIY-YIG nuclease family protein [Desulfosporosinus youngiae]|uniref:Putative endonuclease n=1 Tax=Desulfosporosinus youngiae DSM 17734 TaxID=768710 RepID=H5XVT4_9FIRM|nr:GIY-YIG nuclease family protein [Desulfosporosinus youngiae]EHQ90240.1 putative endonuclease [Desulfosporosinus youngiae DSM 17734]
MEYWVYLARCGNNTIYTGATTDLRRRLKEHNGTARGKGARYTASHLPVTLAQAWQVGSWSEALRLEYAIKQCPRIEKEQLINQPDRISQLAERRNLTFSILEVSQEFIHSGDGSLDNK